MYRIFASHEYDDRHILNSFNFKDKDVFGKYIEDVFLPTRLAEISGPMWK